MSLMQDSPLFQLPNTFRSFYGAFSGLYPAQREAIAPILQGRDLVLQAATGSGKSEAVLAPCMERVILSGRSRTVLYIIPTRALAVDLKRRFESVIKERLGLNLAIRTGDVKSGRGKCPDIMFTTPESLDVMLGSSNADLRGFLFRVETVIIDEVHPLVHQYRGHHLACLLSRLEQRTGRPLQRIAMSATIADVDAVIDFFGFSPGTRHIVTRVERSIVARLVHLKKEESELPALLYDLYETWNYRKILVFANSRGACDRLFGIVNRGGKFQGVCELHYSNLKPLERKGAEQRFRKRSHALCIATSTLELGIDVGDVDAVLLYEPPDSVSAFLQRAGRANRRETEVNFWGLCRGGGAGDQLMRFLALLELSRRGVVESPSPKTLPSVLSQQVVSCLYEKKQISIASLQSLFPEHHALLPPVFESLEKKRWLRNSKVAGLFEGGWHYYDHLFEYKIWGNLPEAEEVYALEVSGLAIADIPQSIVKQFEVGDRIHLAGRGLRILKIETGERKKVLARPSTGKDEKQIAWIGMGAHVSYEVAQAMGQTIRTGEIEDRTCLFARTSKLLGRELDEKVVVLENGIEVVPGKKAQYRYRTFLGSVGNLVLEWSIREHLQDDDLTIVSHEIGIESSQWIDFEELGLPENREEFNDWVRRHFKILQALFPLNLFCKTLSENLLIEELTDFLFDPRVARLFAHYLGSRSDIVSGDRAWLEIRNLIEEEQEPLSIDMAPGDSTLLLEKEAMQVNGSAGLADFLDTERSSPPVNTTLTATMLGDYFLHRQCQRRFCLKCMGAGSPARQADKQRTMAMEQGVRHEAGVLKHLTDCGENLIAMDTRGSSGAKFQAFLTKLKFLIHAATSEEAGFTGPVYLSQCMLKANFAASGSADGRIFEETDMDPETGGTGIPDLLALSVEEIHGTKRVVVQVGDIKSSTSPRYHHKWQVAFYALLLKEIIRFHDLPLRVADRGFIMTRLSGKPHPYETHYFDLQPYMAAFPMLLGTMRSLLCRPVWAAGYRLQSHCTSCEWFSCCYTDALEQEDIQFLPRLTSGELLKLRKAGWLTMAEAHAGLEKISHLPGAAPEEMGKIFTPEQKKQLQGRCAAFMENKILLQKRNTRLFPHNISRAFFLHLVKEPMSGVPMALAWRMIDHSHETREGDPGQCRVWIMESDQERFAAWREFAGLISNAWEEGILHGKGPHLFHFGNRTRLDLLEWTEGMDAGKPAFFQHPSNWTDLQKVFHAHFHMPLPGVASLFHLGHLFAGVKQASGGRIERPESLFHDHGPNHFQLESLEPRLESRLSIMGDLYAKARLHLESRWTAERENGSGDAAGLHASYTRFIREERRLREEDILTLQESPLQERMQKFRAIGYLGFGHTRLDHEGRFLYILNASRETTPSKFRKGDFLKLAPHGIADIQSGFSVIMAEYDMEKGEIALLSRSGRLSLSKKLRYSLEEDTGDWTQAKLLHVVDRVFSGDQPHALGQMLAGQGLTRQSADSLSWLNDWLIQHDTGLNASQKRAMALPFQYRTGMIQGPPGTGKTHLLGWILISLIMQAHEAGKPLRIGVSALTHQAIDNVLEKVTALVNQYMPDSFPGHCVKWGKAGPSAKTDSEKNKVCVEVLDDAAEVRNRSWLILGATGYGFYNLFDSKKGNFPPALDWVVFDEASQVLVPQALLTLVYGRGNFLFLGDVNQLPPIVKGDYGECINNGDASGESNGVAFQRSILENLLALYPETHQAGLTVTYRMNREICDFPSRMWYQGMLHPASANARARLSLNGSCDRHIFDPILDPSKPVTLVLMDHHGCAQKSTEEADLMAGLAHRLITCHGMDPDQMALISPHRAQNNAILQRLRRYTKEEQAAQEDIRLPLVDTVERVQGAERDLIIFGLTSSDPDHLASAFLNSPNRLNVAMTRAKTKLIVIGSQAFFSSIPDSDAMLAQNSCFKRLLSHCQQHNAVFKMLPSRGALSSTLPSRTDTVASGC